MVVGQNVLVDVTSTVAGTPPTVNADQIQLLPTQVCGTAVGPLTSPNVVLNNLSGTLTGASETSILGVTSATGTGATTYSGGIPAASGNITFTTNPANNDTITLAARR